MSRDKPKAANRRRLILLDIVANGGVRIVNHVGGIPLDQDLSRLVGEGLVKLERKQSGSVFGPHIRRTLARLTEAGKKELED